MPLVLDCLSRASKTITLTFRVEPFGAVSIVSVLGLLGRFRCISGMTCHVHEALALAGICS
jgi:hypothetical protein